MWIDPDFDVCRATLSIRDPKEAQLFALPLSYVYPGSKCVVKETSVLDIDHFDILQGGIGDCWLLSAISTIAFSCPDLIEQMIIYNDDVFGLTVFKILNYYIPVDHFIAVIISSDGSSEAIGPKVSKQNEYWPILLEKAILKIFNSTICPFDIFDFNTRRRLSKGTLPGVSYVDINGGFPRWALSVLLNTKLDPIHTKSVPDILSILECEENERLIACACTSTEKNDSHIDEGFVYGHAYSVLTTYKDDQNQLIRVRNPWGIVESTKWAYEMNDHVDDGEFWVDVAEFKERFPIMCVVKIKKTTRKLQ